MKKHIVLLSLLISAFSAFSQNSLTYKNNALLPGDANTSSEIQYVTPGNSGTNQIWDFSRIKYTGTDNSSRILSTATTKLANGKEIATTMVNSSQGKNVTLHTILMPAPKNMPANESIIAFWDLDGYNHAILTSEMDLNNTTQIVETLKLLP